MKTKVIALKTKKWTNRQWAMVADFRDETLLENRNYQIPLCSYVLRNVHLCREAALLDAKDRRCRCMLNSEASVEI